MTKTKFKVMRRTDLINDLSAALSVPHKEAEIVTMFPCGKTEGIIKVEERGGRTFLWPYADGDPMLKLAPFFGSKVHRHTPEEIVDLLGGCSSEDLWLSAPQDDDPQTRVGGLVAHVDEYGRMILALAPVPPDIEDFNDTVEKIVDSRCSRHRSLGDCDKCQFAAECETRQAVAREEAARRKKAKCPKKA